MGKKKQEKIEKKYTIIYSLGLDENGKEDIWSLEADYWMEDVLAGGSVILAGNLDINTSLIIPFIGLKGIHQNFGVREDVERFAQSNEKMRRRKELMEIQNNKTKDRDKDVT